MQDAFLRFGEQRHAAMLHMTQSWSSGTGTAVQHIQHAADSFSKPDHVSVDASALESAQGSAAGAAQRRGGRKRPRADAPAHGAGAAPTDTQSADPFSVLRVLLHIGAVPCGAGSHSGLPLLAPQADAAEAAEDGGPAQLPTFDSAAHATDALVHAVPSAHTAAVEAVVAAPPPPPPAVWKPSPAAAHILMDVALSPHVARGK